MKKVAVGERHGSKINITLILDGKRRTILSVSQNSVVSAQNINPSFLTNAKF